ncbi:unnamed protein product [Blumeria hordei]|uniref:LicD/FKTN/FKRP nucleotidyltransferase domain-containing protein n=1 Tax=Blumeria hordei TaxID=2867405 RepID=A0A383V0E6_BLUHO|nr:unnamed protein product [Blumeria hordei]
MPWDWDLDTQVTVTTLNWLAENLNMSTHRHYMIDDEGNSVGGNFLLDVNPNHIDRLRGSGNNVIDARWIDVHSGLYIDITGVGEIEDDLDSDLLGCKDFHRYHIHELYPLRTSIFEGVIAKIPFMFESILIKEYSAKALSNTEYAGHCWDPEKQAWIKQRAKTQEITSNSTVQV